MGSGRVTVARIIYLLWQLSLTIENWWENPHMWVFIDFSKAYGRIKRHKLRSHLNGIGVPNKFISALKSLYQNVECSVKINGNLTDWFPVNIGLKQGLSCHHHNLTGT